MVDQNFVSNIRAAELKADELIQAAKDEANRAIEDVRSQSAKIAADARKQAEQEQKEALEAAQRKVETIESEAASATDIAVDDSVISVAAKAVAERIVKYSVDR